jgi:hypothetical protein
MGVEKKPVMRIDVTFKQSEKELWEKVSEKSSPSAFIKDVLKEHFKSSNVEHPQQKKPTLPSFKGV